MQEIHAEKRKRFMGLRVKSVARGSPFMRAGLKKGDEIIAVDGQRIDDTLDFAFYSSAYSFTLDIFRGDNEMRLDVTRDDGSYAGVDFIENPINCCRNNCVFCFIDQMPKGLRRGLYIKDEDFKHSFLNGNYVTLTGAKPSDLEKIVRIGLSPLYISVHATDDTARKRMLGITRAPDIMEQLRYLSSNGICFNAQIVLCPTYNDGPILEKSINDLLSFGDALMSVAIVPVGLTKHREIPLPPVTEKIARNVCEMVMSMSDAHYAVDKKRKLFCADEFFIKAGMRLPPAKYYEDYPQIENGVGLVRKLLNEWKSYKKEFTSRKIKLLKKKKKHLVISSLSASRFIEDIIHDALKVRPDFYADFKVIPMVNKFFGEMVTVAGLMTAKDVIATVKKELHQQSFDKVILPAIMFGHKQRTLDGYSAERIEKITGVPVVVVRTVEELLR
ncbi:MAG: DUF512 domain-containing protein [Fibrobacterota bacterium]|nr:DUF512 domain-containing protein [Chitinispirillaceae bacterium]